MPVILSVGLAVCFFLPFCVSDCQKHGYVGICDVRDSRGVRYANKPRTRQTRMARKRDSEAQREREER